MALLDVVQEEPAPPQALIEHERVLLTPHAAFYSKCSLAELKANALETILGLLQGTNIKTVVNPDCVSGGGKGICLN
ncbi:D-lactate dehydrogenase [compost metagenome]